MLHFGHIWSQQFKWYLYDAFSKFFFFLALLFFILVSFPRRIFYRVTKKGNHSPRLTYYQFCNPRGECALIFQKHWQESLVQLRTHTHHLPLAKEIWYSDWHFWVSCPTPTLEGDEFHQDLIGQEEGKKSCREKKKKYMTGKNNRYSLQLFAIRIPIFWLKKLRLATIRCYVHRSFMVRILRLYKIK